MVSGFGPEDILADIPKAGMAKLSKFLQWKSITFPSGCKGNNIVENFGIKRLVQEIGDGKRGRVREKTKTPAAINRAEERKAQLQAQPVPVPSTSTDTFLPMVPSYSKNLVTLSIGLPLILISGVTI